MATSRYKTASPYTMSLPTASSTQPPSSPVQVALVGLGRIGAMYLAHIQSCPDMTLVVVVVSPRQDPLEMRSKFSVPRDVHVTNNLEAALGNLNVDAVIIATTTATHVGVITASLAAGKAVFCEKPISDDLQKTISCYEAASKAKLPLFCAFNRRFDPTYVAIHKKARAGAVGHIQTIKSVSRDSPVVPKEFIPRSGGIFNDFAVHDLDLLLWVIGDVPKQVFVSGSANIPEFAELDDYDCAIILLTFRSGTLGTIDLNRFCNYGYDQRLEVFGAKGMLHCEHSRPNNVTFSDQAGSNQAPCFYSFPSHYEAAFKEQLQHFVRVFRGEERLGVTKKMVCAVSKVVQACQESAVTGAPVQLVWEDSEVPLY